MHHHARRTTTATTTSIITMAPPADMTLAPHPTIPKPDGPVMVCILDGWGVNAEDEYNAVFSAETPCTDGLRAVPLRYRTVKAHGTAVGLPSDADMGNSEVGHNALGSGQVVDQGARLVDLALSTGKMFEGAGWKLISQAFADHAVHFIGLLSDGGVHSRYDQLIGCVRGAVERGAKKVRVHVLTDGRDVPDGSSAQFVAQLQDDLKALNAKGDGVDCQIASGGGRMNITMDRYEADWGMVKRGWDAHVLGKAPHTFTDALTAVKTLRVSCSGVSAEEEGMAWGGSSRRLKGGLVAAVACVVFSHLERRRRLSSRSHDDPVANLNNQNTSSPH